MIAAQESPVPSFRLDLSQLVLQSAVRLDSRQEIELELKRVSHSRSARKGNKPSHSPHRIPPKPQPGSELSKGEGKKRGRLELQPPPNDYATFKKENLMTEPKSLWADSTEQYCLEGKWQSAEQKQSLGGKLPGQEDCEVEMLMKTLMAQLLREEVGKQNRKKARKGPSRKEAKELAQLLAKSKRELELERKIIQLDEALKLKR